MPGKILVLSILTRDLAGHALASTRESIAQVGLIHVPAVPVVITEFSTATAGSITSPAQQTNT